MAAKSQTPYIIALVISDIYSLVFSVIYNFKIFGKILLIFCVPKNFKFFLWAHSLHHFDYGSYSIVYIFIDVIVMRHLIT